MPEPTLAERHAMIGKLLDEIQAKCDAATPGPWGVWDGPDYVGGGKDLCIGAGETWLFNMENRECRRLLCHWHECDLTKDTPIASAGGEMPCNCPTECEHEVEITAEQAANAALVAASRTWLPALLAFARGEWDRAGRIGLKVGRYSAEVDEILTRLETKLAPQLDKGGE